ncbi:MAG: hypothetical protein ABIP29_00385 [Candidatus Eisenbacteria bacterium]
MSDPALRAADRRARRSIVRAAAVFVLAAAAVGAQLVAAERVLPRHEPLGELAYYPSGTWLTQAALGDATAWSDLLWLRAVQYYGHHRQVDNDFAKMAHVFDIITTLDPRFRSAYVFGGTSLCQEGNQFAAGVTLLEKGQHHNPREWIYPFELGFVHYVGRKNLTRATFDFAQAARQPEAPEFCERFAAWSGQKAGYEAVAFELWRQVAETTDNAYMRDRAIEYLRKLVKGTAQARNLEIWAKSLPPLEGGPSPGEGDSEGPDGPARPEIPRGQRVSQRGAGRGTS